jgi:ketosteroid isomerase-like protein
MRRFTSSASIIFMIVFLFSSISLYARQGRADKKDKSGEMIQKEIRSALDQWNIATGSRDLNKFMALLDDTPEVMIVGSDSAEIFKGRGQIESWIKKLFVHNGFTWEMSRIDIDYNGNTAWVFVDGTEVITTDKGKVYRNPYRFTGILVKKNKQWKWRLFDGSYPN